MRYPNNLRLYFLEPKRRFSLRDYKALEKMLKNFDEVIVSRSGKKQTGLEYEVEHVVRWDFGFGLKLCRKSNNDDRDMVPDNLKKK